MSRRHFLKDTDGNIIIAVNDGSFYTETIVPDTSRRAYFYIEFYSDANGMTPIAPTGGDVYAYSSPLGTFYLSAKDDDGRLAEIDAISVTFPNAKYIPIRLDGLSVKFKMELVGVVGAAYCKAVVYRH